MNAAALARIKVISETRAELIQNIKDSTMKQRFREHSETVIYQDAKENEILVLSQWQSLASLPDFEGIYRNPINRGLVASSRLVQRDIFRMIKDYRVVTINPALSRLRVFTLSTTEPEKQLNWIVELPVQAVKEGLGLTGLWIGRAVNEPENTLKVVVRMDWNSEPEHQKFRKSERVMAFFADFQAMGGKLEHGGLNLQGILPTPDWQVDRGN